MSDYIKLAAIVVLFVAGSAVESYASGYSRYNQKNDATYVSPARQQARAVQQIANTYQQQQNQRSSSHSRWMNKYLSNQTSTETFKPYDNPYAR